jgi:diacylglycerol kinase
MTKSEIRMSKEPRNPNDETVAPRQHRFEGQASGETIMLQKTSQASPSVDLHDPHHEHRRRPAWRQRLVQAERGLVRGVRSDSAFFVHFFGIVIVIAAALVLGIGWMQWVAIAGCLTLVLTAEMFNQALKTLAQASERELSAGAQRALAIGTAAVLVACIGSTVVLALVFWQRFEQLFKN